MQDYAELLAKMYVIEKEVILRQSADDRRMESIITDQAHLETRILRYVSGGIVGGADAAPARLSRVLAPNPNRRVRFEIPKTRVAYLRVDRWLTRGNAVTWHSSKTRSIVSESETRLGRETAQKKNAIRGTVRRGGQA